MTAIGPPAGEPLSRRAPAPDRGRWRVVRVRYPNRFPPAWGRSPWAAVGAGLLLLIPSAFVLYGMGSLVSTGDVPDIAALIGLVIVAVPLAVLFYGLSTLWSGAADLGRRAQLEGLVLRRKEVTTSDDSGTHTVAVYLAVYDGRGSEVRALRCPPAVASGVKPGSEVRATISPRLAHVYSLERLAPMVSTQTGS